MRVKPSKLVHNAPCLNRQLLPKGNQSQPTTAGILMPDALTFVEWTALTEEYERLSVPAKIMSQFAKLIDFRAATLFALSMGIVVWFINVALTSPPDFVGATTAAVKQFAYTFFIGGLLFSFMNRLAVRPGKTWKVIAVASTVPTIIASALVYLLHSLRGTPAPLLSSLPTIAITAATAPFLALHRRRQFLKGERTT